MGRQHQAVPAAFTTVHAAYAAALERAPLDGDTRRAYDSRVRTFLAWLEASGLNGDPLTDAHDRDFAVRHYKTHMKTVLHRTSNTVNANLSPPWTTSLPNSGTAPPWCAATTLPNSRPRPVRPPAEALPARRRTPTPCPRPRHRPAPVLFWAADRRTRRPGRWRRHARPGARAVRDRGVRVSRLGCAKRGRGVRSVGVS